MVVVFKSHISAAHILLLEFYLILMFVGTVICWHAECKNFVHPVYLA